MSKVLGPFFFLAVAVGLFFTYIDPAYKGIQALRMQEDKLDEALTTSKELRQKREGLLALYSAFSDKDLARLQKLLPDTVDNVRLIIDIDNVAAMYGLRVRNFTFTELVQEPSVAEVPYVEEGMEAPAPVVEDALGIAQLSFSVVAPYADFVAFLRDLETSLRLVDVRRIEVDSKRREGDEGVPAAGYTFNVTLDTYWLR